MKQLASVFLALLALTSVSTSEAAEPRKPQRVIQMEVIIVDTNNTLVSKTYVDVPRSAAPQWCKDYGGHWNPFTKVCWKKLKGVKPDPPK